MLLNQFGEWGSYVITSENAVSLAEKACRGGAKVIQYRDKTSSFKQRLKTAKELCRICDKYGTLFIVNDYFGIALIVGAGGVHLGQDDVPISDIRKIAPDGFVIGVSTHSVEQAKNAEFNGADYIGIGPVFSTPTKPNYTPIGLDTVQKVVKAARIPVVAIGGINLTNIPQLKDIGIVNIAMVRGFAVDTEDTISYVNNLLIGE